MPVNSHHPEYEVRSKDWKKCRDAFEGEAAISAPDNDYIKKKSEK